MSIGNESSKKFEKVTAMFTKLAEQVKTHLVYFEEYKSSAEKAVR